KILFDSEDNQTIIYRTIIDIINNFTGCDCIHDLQITKHLCEQNNIDGYPDLVFKFLSAFNFKNSTESVDLIIEEVCRNIIKECKWNIITPSESIDLSLVPTNKRTD